VIKNWENEFDAWGHFAVAVFQDKTRMAALDSVRDSINEILVCGKSLFSMNGKAMSGVKWKLIIVDEYHEFKNRNSTATECLEDVKRACKCPVIGLTGTG